MTGFRGFREFRFLGRPVFRHRLPSVRPRPVSNSLLLHCHHGLDIEDHQVSTMDNITSTTAAAILESLGPGSHSAILISMQKSYLANNFTFPIATHYFSHPARSW